jgi:glycine cleavage system H protein
MKIEKNAKYQKTHEWVKEEKGMIFCGITDYAQDSLGDIVFVELPELGVSIKKGESFGVVESVKSASDVYMPLSGEILEVNPKVGEDPAIVNEDAFGEGWFFKFKPDNIEEMNDLLSDSDYIKYVETLDE